MNDNPSFWLSRDEVRELDRRAIDEFGVPGVVLMENAGRGAAELLMRLNPERQRVTILCGPGNNGGDGFVIARHLEIHGWPARLWLVAPSKESVASLMRVGISPKLSPDAEVNFRIFWRAEPSPGFIDARSPDSVALHRLKDEIENSDWIVDALFGTGLDRKLAFPFDQIVEFINASGNSALAVDIPSGLDCDTGRPLGPTVKATHTATFVAWKKGFLQPEAKPWVGEVHVIDIGAPKRLVDQFRQLRAGDE